ncbi:MULTISPECIES: FtsK/SpoIIIE domain-containing protein [Bacillus]|uniref:FtsK/SpoIIIE domain-containing protein n=1 Tax=Bacillus TaxID=1386 RepID=UPI001E3C0EBB|nr:FtsK/SpoIIIE domain-containing protein [Bacillus rhizoplanae]
MIAEIASSVVVGGVVLYTKLCASGATDDAAKISRICANCGLKVKESGEIRTIHLLRRTRHEWGTEYAYRIPLGLSFADFQAKLPQLQDGLNHKRWLYDFKLSDLRELRFQRDILYQIRNIIMKKTVVRKEVELTYDGVLQVRVYEKGMPDFVPFEVDMLEQCHGWQVPIGFTRDGLVKHDFDKIAHLIYAGTTDSGKSNGLKLIITALVHNNPEYTKLVLIDLKGGLSFNRFRDLPQVETIAKNPTEARAALKTVSDTLDEKHEYLLCNGYEDVKEAGMPDRLFIVVDEAADIAKDTVCQDILADIGRRGRAAGLRLIYATQYPTNETLSSQLRQNIGARVCFKLQTEAASRAVLDEGGAEILPNIKGRAIYQTNKRTIVQTPKIENKQIDDIIGPLINIRTRRENERAKVSSKGSKVRKHTLELTETRLSD